MILNAKVEKNDEEGCLSFFKAGLWQMGFSDAVRNSNVFSRN